MSKIEVNTVDVQCGSTLTLGSSGKTVTLASGASQTGFGRTGTVDWCTTVKTSPFTATSGNGYFVNTTSGEITVTLPSGPSAGDIVGLTDYAGTFDSNAVTLCRNSSKIKGGCSNLLLKDERQATTIVYVDGTQGWVAINDTNVCGAALKPDTYTLQYLVVAGGGGGGHAPNSPSGCSGGGGGAGGFRTISCKSFTVSSGVSYPITVGGGGPAGGTTPGACDSGSGSNSVFSTITSTGGGFGGNAPPSNPPAGPNVEIGGDGGSGGGGGSGTPSPAPGGSGNTPPVSPPQGKDGGGGIDGTGQPGGGGGGHTQAGQTGATTPSGYGGYGGAGTASTIRGAPFDPVSYAGGGGGGSWGSPTPPGAGGTGGGGAGGIRCGTAGGAGTINSGGGGGGAGVGPSAPGAGLGGSGIVILRRLTSSSCSASGTVTTCGSDTIHTFTGDGCFAA